jgi:hypothetical protein
MTTTCCSSVDWNDSCGGDYNIASIYRPQLSSNKVTIAEIVIARDKQLQMCTEKDIVSGDQLQPCLLSQFVLYEKYLLFVGIHYISCSFVSAGREVTGSPSPERSEQVPAILLIHHQPKEATEDRTRCESGSCILQPNWSRVIENLSRILG